MAQRNYAAAFDFWKSVDSRAGNRQLETFLIDIYGRQFSSREQVQQQKRKLIWLSARDVFGDVFEPKVPGLDCSKRRPFGKGTVKSQQSLRR